MWGNRSDGWFKGMEGTVDIRLALDEEGVVCVKEPGKGDLAAMDPRLGIIVEEEADGCVGKGDFGAWDSSPLIPGMEPALSRVGSRR